MTAQYSWQTGKQRRTPDGKSLGGLYRETMWRRVITRRGRRKFFEDARDFVDQLRPYGDFLNRLSSDGGRATVIINLPGDVNMGDVLARGTLQMMSELGLELGIEVFPTMNNP